MHIAVIGAGTAGLCSAKHVLSYGYDVTIYEQTKQIGGTWVYTDTTGVSDYGLQVHTSMYKGLYTNLPKEAMGFPDFKIPEQQNSYVGSEDVLDFLKLYADKFNIRDYIKFEQLVIRVRPKGHSQWEIIVKDLPSNKFNTHVYDAVMICNGHENTPSIPNFPGKKLFKGRQIHSHDYRRPEHYKDEDVLVIGAGPSALDISNAISKFTKSITVSHHHTMLPSIILPEGFRVKPDVSEIIECGAKFVDGSHQEFTSILYCTGYIYSYPFISVDCGISVDDNYVSPLYKHCINITRPTMVLIGLPTYVCAAQMFDLQIRFFLKFLSGQKELPSKVDMLIDTEIEMQRRWALGLCKKQAHVMKREQQHYYDDLAKTAEIEHMKLVYSNIFNANILDLLSDLANYRKNVFKIIDDEQFVKTKLN